MIVVVIIIVLCIITAGTVYVVVKRKDTANLSQCSDKLIQCDRDALQHKKEYDEAIESAKLECDTSLQQINIANKLAVDKLNSDITALKLDYDTKLKTAASDATATLTKEYDGKIKNLTDTYDQQIAAIGIKYDNAVSTYELKIKTLTTDYTSKIDECEKRAASLTNQRDDCNRSLITYTSLKDMCDLKLSKSLTETGRLNDKLTAITKEYEDYKIANPILSTKITPASNGNVSSKFLARNNMYKLDTTTSLDTNVVIIINDTYVLTYNNTDGTNIMSPISDSVPPNSNFYIKKTSSFRNGFNLFSNDRGNLYGIKRSNGGGPLIHLPSWDDSVYSNVLIPDKGVYATTPTDYYGKIDGDHISFFASNTDVISISVWSSDALKYMYNLNTRVLTDNVLNISSDVHFICLGSYVNPTSTPSLSKAYTNIPSFTIDNGKIYQAYSNKTKQYGVNKNTLIFAFAPLGDTNTWFNFTMSPIGELLIADNNYRCFYVNDRFVFSTTEKDGGVIFQIWK